MSYLFEEETYILRGIFFNVYNKLGPGLSERIYQRAICKELNKIKLAYETEKSVDINYDNEKIGQHKLDILVDNKIIIELKSTELMHELFSKQTIGYLKSTGYELALLVNFGGSRLIIKRFINQKKGGMIKSA